MAIDLPIPSKEQLEQMDKPFSLFLHFSIATFTGKDDPCDPSCPHASLFAPKEAINTDNWAETAVAMGASEMCLTAHHGAGFAMWRTNLTDYGVKESRWSGDVVGSMYASARKFGLGACLYFDLADAYHEGRGENASANLARQVSFLNELLTERGETWDRLWLDDYFAAPEFWANMTRVIREDWSPSTLTIPGADGWYDGPSTGYGEYPLWLNTNTTNGTFGPAGSFGPMGAEFRVREADTTIQQEKDGARARWFWENKAPALSAAEVFERYVSSVGRGGSLILNVPPSIWGGIGPAWQAEMSALGHAINASFRNPLAIQSTSTTVSCGPNTTTAITLPIPPNIRGKWDVVITREDLSKGQRIASYLLEASDNGQDWTPLHALGGTVGARVFDIQPSPTPNTTAFLRARCTSSITQDATFRDIAIGKMTYP